MFGGKVSRVGMGKLVGQNLHNFGAKLFSGLNRPVGASRINDDDFYCAKAFLR